MRMTSDQLPADPTAIPKYSIRAAARLVGVSPVTLRAWERRYRLRTPLRTPRGYRLYSERDVKALRWLKSQAEAGVPLAHAAHTYIAVLTAGRAALHSTPRFASQADATQSLATQGDFFLEHLLSFDNRGAEAVLRAAEEGYSEDEVLSSLIPAVMREIGDRWHRGEVTIAAEHFASQFLVRYLTQRLRVISASGLSVRVLAACAPGEHHEIGLLALSAMLVRRGVEVLYLGPNLALDRLEENLRQLHPHALLFSATRKEAAEALAGLDQVLQRGARDPIAVLLGGAGFRDARPERFPFATLFRAESPSTLREVLSHLTREATGHD
jgi:MerR family transcriptional regulator, light-induced transcriptional regulator